MPDLFGKKLTKQQLLEKIGNISQISSFERIVFNQGKSSGVKAVNVDTGGGLEFCVIEDKALDIFKLSYKGVNLNFVAKPGLVSPAMYDPSGLEFLRSFQGGFLYTCGLTNVGPEIIENGKTYPMHGRIGGTPAENVSLRSHWTNDEYLMEISGEIRENALFGENLIMRRTITTSLGARSLKISDVVENQGSEDQEILLLFHMNLGYPLLDESTRLFLSSLRSEPRSESEKEGYELYDTFTSPIHGADEQVIYHYLSGDNNNDIGIAVFNKEIGLGVAYEYSLDDFPYLTQWKSMKAGDYALGIEPGNTHPEGRIVARERNEFDLLRSGESKTYTMNISIIDNKEELSDFLEKHMIEYTTDICGGNE